MLSLRCSRSPVMRSVPCLLPALALILLTGRAPAADPRPELFLQTGHTAGLTGVALTGDSKLVLTGSDDGTAILWQTEGGKKIQTFQGHTYEVTSVALGDDGKHAVTGSRDGKAILWEAASGKKLQTFQGSGGGITSVA